MLPTPNQTAAYTLRESGISGKSVEYWMIPPKEDGKFVACIENVLGTHELPYHRQECWKI